MIEITSWTVETLKELVDQRFADNQKAVDTALLSQEKAVNAALLAAKEAVKRLCKQKQIWYNVIMSNFRGEHNNNWKGDDISYAGINVWLRSEFGNPLHCEQCGKIGKKVNGKWNIQWTKLKDKEYQRRRQNFWGLCVKCHTKYDDKCPAGWNKGIPNTGFQRGYTPWNKGKNLTPETIEKMQGRIPWNKGKRGLQVAWNKGIQTNG